MDSHTSTSAWGTLAPTAPPAALLAHSARQTIGPVLDSSGVSGSSAYRLHGADTLTWGSPTAWVRSKLLLFDAQQLLKPDKIGDMPTQDSAAQDSAAELLNTMQALAQRQAALRVLPPSDSSDFVTAVSAALAREQPLLARSLADHGHRLYPEHRELARLAAVLAPPKLIAALPPDPDVALNMAWLTAHRAEYTGQWVAVAAGVLRGAAPSLRELKTAVGELQGMLITRIL